MDWINLANVLDPFGGKMTGLASAVEEARRPLTGEEKEEISLPQRALRFAIGEIPTLAGIALLSGGVGTALRGVGLAAKLGRAAGLAKWGLTGGLWEAGKPSTPLEEKPIEFVKGAATWGTIELGLSALGKFGRYLFNRGVVNKNFQEIHKMIKEGKINEAVEKCPPAHRDKFKDYIREEAEKRGIPNPLKEEYTPKPEPFVEDVVADMPREAQPQDAFMNKVETFLKDATAEEKKELTETLTDFFPQKMRWWEKYSPFRPGGVMASPVWNKHLSPVFKELDKQTSEAKEFTKILKDEAKPYFSLNETSRKRVDAKLIEAYFNKDFTPAKLAEAKLTPEEIEGFISIRRGYDKAIFEVIPEIMRKAGIPEEDITAFIQKHHRKNYFSAYRFGQYVTTVKRGKNTLWSSATDDYEQAQVIHKALMKKYPGAEVKTIDIFQQEFRYPNEVKDLYMISHHIDDIEKFLKSKGIADKSIEEFKKVVDETTIKKWATGRFAPRYDIPGFSPDIGRAYLAYAETVPRAFIKRFGRTNLYREIDKVPAIYKKEVRSYLDKMMEGPPEKEISSTITSAMYHLFLGFKPAYSIRNLSQRFTTTLSRSIMELGSMKEGMKTFVEAQRDSLKYFKGFWNPKQIWKGDPYDFLMKSAEKIEDKYIKTVMKRMIRQGNIHTGMREEIMPGVKNKIWKKFLEKSNMFVLHSDASNRLVSALNAARIAKTKGMSIDAAVDFTRDFIVKTQWRYSYLARPEYLKGWGRPLFLFKSWVDNYLRSFAELYGKNKKAFMTQMAIMLALSGAEGAPFIADLENIVDEYAKIQGWIEWPQHKNKWRTKTPRILREGIPSLIGIPGSWTFGQADMLPTEFPPVKLAQQIWEGAKSLTDPNIPMDKKLYYFSPIILKHVLVAATDTGMIPSDMHDKPRYTMQDIKRLPKELRPSAYQWYMKIPKEWPKSQRILYGIGFSCLERKEIMNFYRGLKEIGSYEAQLKKKLHIAMARALKDNDPDDAREILRYAAKKGLKLDRNAIKKYYYEFLEKGG